MKNNQLFLKLVFCMVIFPGIALGQSGSLDNSFGTGGIVTTDYGGLDDQAYSVVVQTDGKIIVGGRSGNLEFALTRYNVNGSLDVSFDLDGKVITSFGSGYNYCHSLVLQSDGKIIAVGYTDPDNFSADFALARFNPNGSLDNSFGSGGKVTTDFGNGNKSDIIFGAAIQNDGKIVVAGQARNSTFNQYDVALARYNSDGTLDNSFDSDGTLVTSFGSIGSSGKGIAIQPDGKIVVAGFTDAPSDDDFLVIRYNSNGSLDNSFDVDGFVTTSIATGNDAAFSMCLQQDGKILVAGYSNNGSGEKVAMVRYNVDGSLDNSFDSDGKLTTDLSGVSERCLSISLQNDGKILATGYTGPSLFLLRYNNTGVLDNTFDMDGQVIINPSSSSDKGTSVTTQGDGKAIVVGWDQESDFLVLRFNGDLIGFEENNNADNLLLYPNPTNGELKIDFETLPTECIVEVLNVIGQKIDTYNFITYNGSSILEISGEPGVYYLSIQLNDSRIIKKIIKE